MFPGVMIVIDRIIPVLVKKIEIMKKPKKIKPKNVAAKNLFTLSEFSPKIVPIKKGKGASYKRNNRISTEKDS